MPSSDKRADLSRLDPERLRRISKNLPSELASAVQRLAEHAERGSASPEDLQALRVGLEAGLPQLQALLASIPGLGATANHLPPEIRSGLAELRANTRDEAVRSELEQAERHAEDIEQVAASLGARIEGFKRDLQEAGRALAENKAPKRPSTQASGVDDAQERLTKALSGFAASIGRAAKAAQGADESTAYGLSELWLRTLAALSVPPDSPLQRDAAQTCFQAALRAGHLDRGRQLATALTAQAMAASDWESAAVIQHTLADKARESGDLDLLVQARSKEALLLSQAPEYSQVATQMMGELRTLTASGPLALQAVALLHSGDVAQRSGTLAEAQSHWKALLALPEVSEAEPALAGRALASLGYLQLDRGKFKAAGRGFRAALACAEKQGGWELMGPAIRGLLTSLVQSGDTAGATQALQHAKRLALAHGGASGVVGLSELAKSLGL